MRLMRRESLRGACVVAVSKSLRFAILRRDQFTCRYCGAHSETAAASGGLEIDHIIPTSHGGTDDPTNLVAACRDCNSGKAATPAEVSAPNKVLMEKLREQVMELRERAELDRQVQELNTAILEVWRPDLAAIYEAWETALTYADQPGVDFLIRHLRMGVSREQLVDYIYLAESKAGRGMPAARYFYGICRNVRRKLEDAEDEVPAE